MLYKYNLWLKGRERDTTRTSDYLSKCLCALFSSTFSTVSPFPWSVPAAACSTPLSSQPVVEVIYSWGSPVASNDLLRFLQYGFIKSDTLCTTRSRNRWTLVLAAGCLTNCSQYKGIYAVVGFFCLHIDCCNWLHLCAVKFGMSGIVAHCRTQKPMLKLHLAFENKRLCSAVWII